MPYFVRCHCFAHLSFFFSLSKPSVHAPSFSFLLSSAASFCPFPSPPPPHTTEPPSTPVLSAVCFTFPAVGNHAGAWLADKPSCWLMGRPVCVQLCGLRWTIVKGKRWPLHRTPTHPTFNIHTGKTQVGRKWLNLPPPRPRLLLISSVSSSSLILFCKNSSGTGFSKAAAGREWDLAQLTLNMWSHVLGTALC